MSHNVLMLGGWADMAFGIFRQLADIPNIKIVCADASEDPCLHFFKACKKSYRLPKYENFDLCGDAIFEICEKENIDILLPATDLSMLIVSKRKKEFIKSGIKISVPDYDITDISSDKLKLYKHAKKHKINQPKTYLLSETALDEILEEVVFPLIIKLKRGSGQRGLGLMNSKEECEKHINKLLTKITLDDIIIQEYIPGPPLKTMYTTGLLYDHKHRLKLAVPTKKIRELPFFPGGTGICVKTVKNKEVNDFCVNLINSFEKWEGIADIETKTDPRDDKVKLVEINPRPWGINYVLHAAGVNLAYYWIKTALREDFEPVFDFKENVYANTLSRDIIMFFNLLSGLSGQYRKIAIDVLKTYKYPYLIKNHNLPMSCDFKLGEPLPFFKNVYRIRKDIIRTAVPECIMERKIKI